MPKDDLIQVTEERVSVRFVDLKALVDEIKALRQEITSKRTAPNNGAEILFAKDVLKDLGISRKSLDRRLYEWDNPLPMVLEGHKLKIRRDTYEAWKRAIGL